MARAAPCKVDAALAKNLPHRSREHEFTDGRVYEFRPVKDGYVLYEENEFGRVLTTGLETRTSDAVAQREPPKTREL